VNILEHSEYNKTPLYFLLHLFFFALSRRLLYSFPLHYYTKCKFSIHIYVRLFCSMLFNLQLSTASCKCYLITCTRYCLNYFLTITSYRIQNCSLTTTDGHTHTHTHTHARAHTHTRAHAHTHTHTQPTRCLENKLTPLLAATRSDTPSPQYGVLLFEM
jgi:hypothetical protein